MTRYVVDLNSFEGFNEYWDNFDDDLIDDAFSNFLPIYLKSCKCRSKVKTNFLEEFVETIEKDIEALEVKIQSDNFQCKSKSFENLCQSKQGAVLSPFDIQIEEYFEKEFDDS